MRHPSAQTRSRPAVNGAAGPLTGHDAPEK